MNLSPHVTLEEMTVSAYAARHGIANRPGPQVLAQLRLTAARLEAVHDLLGGGLHITSGYRCPALNAAIGGAARSAHITGHAVDFIAPRFGTPRRICRAIAASPIEFDQLIEEGTWVHIAFGPGQRRQVLTMRRGRYRSGLT